MAKKRTVVHVGIRGSVVALDRAIGQIVWSTPLKGGDFVNVVLDGPDLFATTKGEVFCLDPVSGRIRWTNSLKGFGLGLASIAAGAGSMAPMARYHQEQQQAAASSTIVVASVGTTFL